MATIKAPFNFVPLSDKVFFPDWADQISHDVPFEDGVSGKIDITITAKTPIFVRNGHGQSEDKDERFSQTPDGKSFFIPATSIKGELRSLLEIMSFGKMKVDEDAKFAQREWDNKELYPIKDPTLQKTIKCGWLRECAEGTGYEILESADSPYRINHRRLDEYFCKLGKERIFANKFAASSNFNLNETVDNKYDPKTVTYKYHLLESAGIPFSKLDNLSFAKDEEYAVKYQENRVNIVQGTGDFLGQIVLTGQSSQWNRATNRKMGDGKFYEFVFNKEIVNRHPLSEQEFAHYKFIYKDAADWNYIKSNLKKGVPVFFRKSGKKIRDFGFALLYKLPYSNSPADLEQQRRGYREHDRYHDLDLAECIFGKIAHGKEDYSLRGRVFVSNFISKDAEKDDQYKLILNSPKASYYPYYIEQGGRNDKTTHYATYNDGRLAGWKRYIVRKNVWQHKMDNEKLDSTINPLKPNCTFNGSIRFHNLKPEELGALLSAITYFNDNNCFHQLGQGKPYGFGKVTYHIDNFDVRTNSNTTSAESKEYYIFRFEKLLENNNIHFTSDSSIIELFTLAHEEVDANDALYKYMIMDIDNPDNNEFVRAKKSCEFLQHFSALQKATYAPQSLLKKYEQEENDRLEKEKEKRRKEEEQAALRKKMEEEDAIRRELDNLRSSPLADYLATFRLASIVAFAGKLKKRGSITNEDLTFIADKLNADIPTLKKSDQKTWRDYTKWKPIQETIGSDLAQALFEKLK